MRRIKTLASIGVIVLALGFTGCSSKGNETKSDVSYKAKSDVIYGAGYGEDYSTNQIVVGQETPAPVAMEEGFADFTTSYTSNSGGGTVNIANTSQKLIKRMNLTLETLEYDSLLSFLDNKILELTGYVEESNSYGKSLNSDSLRSAYMVVRIPSNRLDEFVNLIGENTTIVARNKTTEDATMAYVDNESRKKALEIQQERLFSLLEEAKKMEDIIALEARISEVTYQLENYTSTLRTFDNLVEYSTVTIQVNEVERVSNPEPENTWDKMKNGLADTMYQIKEGAKNLAIWFVSNIPYIIFWGVLIVAVFIIIKRKLKKRHNNSNSGSNENGSSENGNSEM